MKRKFFSRCGIATIGVCILAVAGAIQFSYAGDGESGESVKKEPATRPAVTKEEETAIRQRLLERLRGRHSEYNYCDVAILKHFAGDYYVAAAVYAKGNAWHLYLTDGKDIKEAGLLLGENGLSVCMNILLIHQGQPKSDEQCCDYIKKCIEAMSNDYGVIVGKNSEIPEYDKNPFADDLKDVIRPMWSYTTKDSRGEKTTHYVTYTYQQIGGQVFRHEFSFTDSKQRMPNTVRLARQIGDVLYLE